MAALAVDQSAAVEAVFGAEQCQQVASVPLLDRSFDDDIQGIGRRILLDNRFARPEVGDVERRTKRSRPPAASGDQKAGLRHRKPWALHSQAPGPEHCGGQPLKVRVSMRGSSCCADSGLATHKLCVEAIPVDRRPARCGPGSKTAICRRTQWRWRRVQGCPA